MSLDAARNTPTMGAGGVPVLTSYPVYQAVVIYKGALVCLNSSGYLVPGATGTTLTTVGIALETVDNTDGSSGEVTCQVMQGVGRWENGNSITLASVGDLCYVVDDQTVSTSATGKSPAGTIYLVDDAGVWVYTGLAAPIDGTSLNAFIVSLASTATAEGGGLVGFSDEGSLYTAANVNAALPEVMKKANAALSVPACFPVILSSTQTNTVVARMLARYPGKIGAMDAMVIVPTTTTGKAATLGALISGVAVTGGEVALTSANTATIGARVTGSSVTGSNSFAEGQEITVTASSVTTFAEGQVLLQMFMDPAA